MSEITLNTYKVYVGILKTTYTHFKIYLRNVVKQSFGAGAAPKVDCFSKPWPQPCLQHTRTVFSIGEQHRTTAVLQYITYYIHSFMKNSNDEKNSILSPCKNKLYPIEPVFMKEWKNSLEELHLLSPLQNIS